MSWVVPHPTFPLVSSVTGAEMAMSLREVGAVDQHRPERIRSSSVALVVDHVERADTSDDSEIALENRARRSAALAARSDVTGSVNKLPRQANSLAASFR